MAIRKVARLGHPVLRRTARPFDTGAIGSAETRRLVADMWETLAEYEGVGLAAPQVHEPVRLAIVALDGAAVGEGVRLDGRSLSPEDAHGGDVHRFVVFNPEVEITDPRLSGYWEGCLSVPGMRGYVERPSGVRIRYLDERARPRVLDARGFLATVFQHELDHLDGILYVDRLADSRLFMFNEELVRHHLRGQGGGEEAEERPGPGCPPGEGRARAG